MLTADQKTTLLKRSKAKTHADDKVPRILFRLPPLPLPLPPDDRPPPRLRLTGREPERVMSCSIDIGVLSGPPFRRRCEGGVCDKSSTTLLPAMVFFRRFGGGGEVPFPFRS